MELLLWCAIQRFRALASLSLQTSFFFCVSMDAVGLRGKSYFSSMRVAGHGWVTSVSTSTGRLIRGTLSHIILEQVISDCCKITKVLVGLEASPWQPCVLRWCSMCLSVCPFSHPPVRPHIHNTRGDAQNTSLNT
jgi:hypothetical protein